MAPYPLVGWSVGSSISRSVCRSVSGPSFSFRQLLIPPMLLPNPRSFIHQPFVTPTCRSTIVTTTTSSRHLCWLWLRWTDTPLSLFSSTARCLSPPLPVPPLDDDSDLTGDDLPSICGAFFFNPTWFHSLMVQHPSLLLDHCDDNYLLTPSYIGFG